ncbi:hypothetical protein GUITHDRAFT_116887 [Guillardia theta CCMP2712]|uniref:Uncharacterized protein n=1 Tax=Guillardia theta (strain CCMP2712) TaxID=905079 RepID=L1ILV3_GUITC|nr:hypothetical protein GUITHDRAFT_116887 [Guillardia theta CCMP2712]EKX36864.1 hypothetical protein GUITHDRAFT_116887 [Guillardia theta CCMP2712]|eukprot:XP_005823844.1 hypothetical protein GUITHDRAFT_116887 [Guillardia theta CCMP2712]
MVDKRAALAAVGVGVTMMALVLLASSSDDALALLSNHHRHAERHLEKALLLERTIAQKDASSLRELSQLAAAADKQASSAKKLKDVETKKLMISSGSKVDAENMLANEAIKKSREIKDQVHDLQQAMAKLSKQLRKDHHLARSEERKLREARHVERDSILALHDRETKVLEARHDVTNAAKAGDLSVLRDAQARLHTRKAIARGARAQEEEDKKTVEQLAAKARLFRKRVAATKREMHKDKARMHNDLLLARERFAKGQELNARANLLRDVAALKAAHKKYDSLEELLDDSKTDHHQVEATLSKIASNLHTWQNLRQSDKKSLVQRDRDLNAAKERVKRKSIALSGGLRSSPQSLMLMDEGSDAGWGGGPVALQQSGAMFSYVPQTQPGLNVQPAQASYPANSQQQFAWQPPPQPVQGQLSTAQFSYQPAQQQSAGTLPQAPPAFASQPQLQQAGAQSGSVQDAPPANPAALPGAVGNIPYVYNDKQFLPSKASAKGYPIVWIFADNKTPDKLFFGFQSSDGVMHVYNEIKPNGVTRQQAFANEYWTILAADKRTVAVQPFKINQNNQWISIQPNPQHA